MQIRDLHSLKHFFKTQIKTPIFGVGVYAFNRLGPEEFIDNYRLLALRYSLDTELIEKDLKVFALEKGQSTKHILSARNSTTVITHPKTYEYLKKFKNPLLLTYKASRKMEKTCQKNGWQLGVASVKFGKSMFENKVKFRRILESIQANSPPGEIISPYQIKFEYSQKKYGLPFVLQHPSRGGGKGTFFIHNQDEFNQALKKIIRPPKDPDSHQDKTPEEIILAKFITGPSPSLTGCVTRQGILSTNLQYQILDMTELYNPRKGSGLFCGHDWTGSRFSEKINRQAYQMVKQAGSYFQKQGYQGIFGLDFILDEKQEKLYLVEANPRLLGSFPTITMVQARNHETPILAFHILEFLRADYQINIDQINNLMRRPKFGGHMFLHNLSGHWARNHQVVKPGVYKLKNNKIVWQRQGYALRHMRNNEEFLLTEGVPFLKSHFSPNRRLCRILTLDKVLSNDPHQLNAWAHEIAAQIYQAFDLQPVKLVKLKKLFKPHFLAKG